MHSEIKTEDQQGPWENEHGLQHCDLGMGIFLEKKQVILLCLDYHPMHN